MHKISRLLLFLSIFLIQSKPALTFQLFNFPEIDRSEIQMSGQTGFHFDGWECSNSDQIMQVHLPLIFYAAYHSFSLSLLTAYAYTSVDPSEGESASLSSLVDTKLNMSYAIIGRIPVDVLFGLDFNLPTGKTSLKEKDLVLITDPDLLTINRFGEGFNVNPTVSIAKEWDKLATAMGLGYVFRGEYDFSENLTHYEPGEIYNITGSVDYLFASDWRAKLMLEYAYYEEDRVDGMNYFQEGDFFLVGISAGHFKTTWDAGISIFSVFRGKNKFLEDEELVIEDKNSSGNEKIINLSYRYFLDKETVLKTLLQYLHVDKNGYPEGTSFFEGERQKFSIGFAVTRSNFILPLLEGEAGMTIMNLDVDKSWSHPNEAFSYKGISMEIKLINRF